MDQGFFAFPTELGVSPYGSGRLVPEGVDQVFDASLVGGDEGTSVFPELAASAVEVVVVGPKPSSARLDR